MDFLLKWLGGGADYNRLRPHFDWPFPLWMLPVLLGMLALSLYWYWTGLRRAPAGRRQILWLGRLAVVLLFLLALFQAALALQHVRYDPMPLAVVVDESASMRLEDEGGKSRREAVRLFFERHASDFTELEQRYQTHYYTLGEDMRPADRNALTAAPNADGKATRISAAIESLASGARRPYAAAVFFTDGADNGRLGALKERGELTPAVLGESPVPLVTVQAGEAADYDDFGIEEGRTEEFAFTQNPLTLKFGVARQGFERYSTLNVDLFQDNGLIGSQTAEFLPADPRRAEVSFTFTPRQTGDFLYKVVLNVPPEDHIAGNNIKVFALKIIRDKIRVLHITGQPSPDTMFMRELLKRNPNVELIAFYILRTNSDIQVHRQNELSLIPFPTEELFFKELHSFDLVVFHDFKFQPYVPQLFLENLRGYLNGGGAFAMIGGPLSFGEGGYDRTAIEDILPVHVGVREGYDPGRIAARLTGAGRVHPITRPDAGTADDPFGGLPALNGINKVGGPKDDALVLLEALGSGGEGLPLAAVYESGKGRSLAFMSDTSWRWQFQTGPGSANARAYTHFWNRAIQWLIRDPFLERIRLSTSKTNYSAGEAVAGTVTLFAPDYTLAEEAEVVLEWKREAGPGMTAESIGESGLLNGMTNEKGEWSFEFTPPADGGYRLRVFAPSPNPDLQVETQTVVSWTRESQETLQPGADAELLRWLASATQGSYHKLSSFRLSDAELAAPEEAIVDRQEILDLWDSALLLALIMATLAFGWWLRKKSGLV